MMKIKRLFYILLVFVLAFSAIGASAESTSTPPAMPSGSAPSGDPPSGNPPSGDAQTAGMAPGGMSGGAPESYAAYTAYSEDTSTDGETYESTGTDENAILVTDGTVDIANAIITRTSDDSTGGDDSSFYGVGAAVLATGGATTITDSTITTDAAGGAGVFAYGDSVVNVSDTTIDTAQDTSGGIHVAGGGTLYANNLIVETNGNSSAAIRSDRGGGTIVADGGTYTANGVGSPAVYVTANITVNDAALTATGSEALCLEGRNSVKLYDCDLTGNMPDQEQNDNTWTVILYQSMSGDAEEGEGRFEMVGGTLTSENGGIFYTTNTQSEFVLSGVEIIASDGSEYFLRCTGNANARGWGTEGANGADCTFTGIAQQMNGDVVWDSISQLDLYLTSGSILTGAMIDDESCAGTGGDGSAVLTIDADSTWIVTGDSTLTSLNCAGTIADADGNAVTIVGTDGTVYVQGTSTYTVTVESYSKTCDLSGAGTAGSFAD